MKFPSVTLRETREVSVPRPNIDFVNNPSDNNMQVSVDIQKKTISKLLCLRLQIPA